MVAQRNGATELVIGRLLSDPAHGARRTTVAAGCVVYDVESPAVDIFLIHRGEVRLYHSTAGGGARLLEILGPGDWFGTASLGRTGRHGSRAVAVSETNISAMAGQRLLEILPEHPQAGREIIQHLAGRVMAANEEASGLAFDDCQQRLVKALLKFSRSAAAIRSGDDIVLRITHEQLAQAVGSARETVSLALTQFRQANLLRTGRNRLTFNPEALRLAAEAGGAIAPATGSSVIPRTQVHLP